MLPKISSQTSSTDNPYIRSQEIYKNKHEPLLRSEKPLEYCHTNETALHIPNKPDLDLELAANIFQAEEVLKSTEDIHQELENIKENINSTEDLLRKTKSEQALLNTKCKECIKQIEEILLPLNDSDLKKIIANIELANSLEGKCYDIISAIYKKLSVLLVIHQTDFLTESATLEIANMLKPTHHKSHIPKYISKYNVQKPTIESLCNTLAQYRAYSLNLNKKIESLNKTIIEKSKLVLGIEYLMLLNSMELNYKKAEQKIAELNQSLAETKLEYELEIKKKLSDIDLYKTTVSETKITIIKNNKIIREELEKLTYQESELLAKKQEMLQALESSTKKNAIAEIFSLKPGQKLDKSMKSTSASTVDQLSEQQKKDYRLKIIEINKILEQLKQDRENLQKSIMNPDADNTSEHKMQVLLKEHDDLKMKSLQHSEQISANILELSTGKPDLTTDISKCKAFFSDKLRKLVATQKEEYYEFSEIKIGTDFIRLNSEQEYLLEFYAIFKEVAYINSKLKTTIIEPSSFKIHQVIEKWKTEYSIFNKYAAQALEILKKIQFIVIAKQILNQQNHHEHTVVYSFFEIDILEKWYSIIFQLSAHELMNKIIELSITESEIDSLYILWQQQIAQDEIKIRRTDQNLNLVANEIINKYSSMIDIVSKKTTTLANKIATQKTIKTNRLNA